VMLLAAAHAAVLLTGAALATSQLHQPAALPAPKQHRCPAAGRV
jgi:hypothetical protein